MDDKTIYIREENSRTWEVFKILPNQNLSDAIRSLVDNEAGHDSDGGYHCWWEIDIAGKRTFIIAEYDGWYDEACGDVLWYEHGTKEELLAKKLSEAEYLESSLINPRRDYLMLDNHALGVDGKYFHRSPLPYSLMDRLAKLGLSDIPAP